MHSFSCRPYLQFSILIRWKHENVYMCDSTWQRRVLVASGGSGRAEAQESHQRLRSCALPWRLEQTLQLGIRYFLLRDARSEKVNGESNDMR